MVIIILIIIITIIYSKLINGCFFLVSEENTKDKLPLISSLWHMVLGYVPSGKMGRC